MKGVVTLIKDYKEQIFNFKNINGKMIHAVYDSTSSNNPLVIICPQYEKTVRTNLSPMVYLINNGFNVFRYDNTFHRGNSEGEFVEYTLSNAYDDLISVMDFVENNPEINKSNGICLFGISISSRICYRFLSNFSNKVDMFLSLVGVVNMRYTMEKILGYDLVHQFLTEEGKVFGICKPLSYPIDLDNFTVDLVKNNYHDLETTKKEIDKIKTPVSLILAESDKWIDINEYDYAFSGNKGILNEIYKMPNSGHELYKNPEAARYSFIAMVRILYNYFYKKDINEDTMEKPQITEIIAKNKHERDRERHYQSIV